MFPTIVLVTPSSNARSTSRRSRRNTARRGCTFGRRTASTRPRTAGIRRTTARSRAVGFASRAIDELRRRHAAYLIGVDLGQVADDSYASIVARMEAVNSGNADEIGRRHRLRVRLRHRQRPELRTVRVEERLYGRRVEPRMSLSDDEVRRYYDEHDWTKDGVDGKAPLDEVRGNVKAQMRSERYDELWSQRAEAIDVTDLPWDALSGSRQAGSGRTGVTGAGRKAPERIRRVSRSIRNGTPALS